jgi:hypothetical protein
MRAFLFGFALGAFWQVWRRQLEFETRVMRELRRQLEDAAAQNEQWAEGLVTSVRRVLARSI